MEPNELDNLSAVLEILRFERLLAIGLGIAAIAFISRFIERTSNRLQNSYPSKRVMFLQVTTMINFVMYIGGVTILFYVVLRPPREILLAMAGSAAVAIGISLKDIVASVVAGVILLFDRPFQVGDRVAFGDTYGEIVGIGLRAVKLTTLDDNLVTIPNARFLTDVVSSGNAGELDMMILFDFHVALDADLKLAKKIVREVVTTSRFAFLKKPVSILSSEMPIAERLAIRIRAKAYVIDCRFEKAFETDVVDRVIQAFNDQKVKRPARNDV